MFMICLCIYGPVFTVYLHSHKKRKDSLKTRAVMLIFLVEFGISSVEFVRAGRTEHTSKQQKMATSARNCSGKMTLRLF